MKSLKIVRTTILHNDPGQAFVCADLFFASASQYCIRCIEFNSVFVVRVQANVAAALSFGFAEPTAGGDRCLLEATCEIGTDFVEQVKQRNPQAQRPHISSDVFVLLDRGTLDCLQLASRRHRRFIDVHIKEFCFRRVHKASLKETSGSFTVAINRHASAYDQFWRRRCPSGGPGTLNYAQAPSEITDEEREAMRIDRENTRTFVTNELRVALELLFRRLRHSIVVDLMSFDIDIGLLDGTSSFVQGEASGFDVHVHGTMLFTLREEPALISLLPLLGTFRGVTKLSVRLCGTASTALTDRFLADLARPDLTSLVLVSHDLSPQVTEEGIFSFCFRKVPVEAECTVLRLAGPSTTESFLKALAEKCLVAESQKVSLSLTRVACRDRSLIKQLLKMKMDGPESSSFIVQGKDGVKFEIMNTRSYLYLSPANHTDRSWNPIIRDVPEAPNSL